MEELVKNRQVDLEMLENIIEKINNGTDIKKVKKKFDKNFKNIDTEELINVEQNLLSKGLTVEQVFELCDIHLQVFHSAIKNQEKTNVVPGHPLHTYHLENRELKKLIKSLKKNMNEVSNKLRNIVSEMKLIDLHYIRKENQLFPFLENEGFTGPSKIMWAKHDEIRKQFSLLENVIEKGDIRLIKKEAIELIRQLKSMKVLEEKVLFPTALKRLPDSSWISIRRGEAEFGYAWVNPVNPWDDK